MSASAAVARASDFVPGMAVGGFLGLALVIGGGLVEGVALGSFQSSVLARWLPRLGARRWTLMTMLVAGAGWAAASAPSQLAAPDGSTPPVALIAVAAAALGAVMGALLGTAQAGGLRRLVRHPRRWIGISTAAWAPAMVVIFLGATTPGADWGYPTVVLLGAATGALAGAVLGLVSGLLAPSLDGRSTVNRVVALVLLSRARTLLSSSVVLIRVRGRLTGVPFELPVQYARAEDMMVVVPGRPERKRWWLNLARPSTIDVLVNGVWLPGTAVALRDHDPLYAAARATYAQRWPRMHVATGDPVVVVSLGSHAS